MLRLSPPRVVLCMAAAFAVPHLVHAERLTLSDDTCRLVTESVPAAFARCGLLTVPEDPSAPDGPTVDLYVAKIAARSATPRPDPLVLIAGGPGQSTIDFYLQQRGAFEQARRDRDLILLDQRGTGRSATGFECSVPDDFALDTAGGDAIGTFVERCLDTLEHDPRFYTTSVAVQDLEQLRAALGIERWNIYGVSYGTRVALHYVRRFPERVRATVLDGVVPPEVALGPDVAREAQSGPGRNLRPLRRRRRLRSPLSGPARALSQRCCSGSRPPRQRLRPRTARHSGRTSCARSCVS